MSEESVVVDRAESKLSDLWKKEDYWAIWIGMFILIFSYMLVMPAKSEMAQKIDTYNLIIAEEKTKPFETVALLEARAAKRKIVGSALPAVKELNSYLSRPVKWSGNPLNALVRSASQADVINEAMQEPYAVAKARTAAAYASAMEFERAAALDEYSSAVINAQASQAVDVWRDAKSAEAGIAKKMAKPYNLIPKMLMFGIGLAFLTAIGIFFMGFNVAKYIIGFSGVFLLCVLANILGKHQGMSYYGIGTEIWAIGIGMIIANTISTPKWLLAGVHVEYFIKSGLVLLGAEVLFNKIIAIGLPGIFVAWVVTPVVLISTYIFGQKVLKIPSKTLNMVISADMSVCGTSAAIATAAACRAKKEELTLAIGLSLTFTAIMMIAMPMFIKAVGMPEILAGAWIGGTVDATGAVAAAGLFIGEKAMYVAATIKMIQNVLIGVTAFCVALYWCTKVERDECADVRPIEIWHRFPKFVIGFLIASIFFSVVSSNIGPDLSFAMVDKGVLSVSKGLRGWFFALAFISIGLATNFRELAGYFKGGKPIILYVCGQSFNLILTLAMAYLMFYVVFPDITANI